MSRMFDLLKEGLEESIAFEKGLSKKVKVKKVKIYTSEVLSQHKLYQADDIKYLRGKIKLFTKFVSYLS